MGIIDSWKKVVAQTFGTAYDYLTPGTGSSRLTDYGFGTVNPSSGGGGGGGGGGGWGSNDSPTVKALKEAVNRPVQQVVYQPPTPRLAQFDYRANWRNAQSAAEKAINPEYERRLN